MSSAGVGNGLIVCRRTCHKKGFNIGPAQRDSIYEAGIALQKGGVIPARVDVKKALDDLIDDKYVATN